MKEIARLAGDNNWTVGDRISLGDIATGTLLGYMAVRFSETAWRTVYPNLVALSDRLEPRASFRVRCRMRRSSPKKVV